jgi:hypothetical protein
MVTLSSHSDGLDAARHDRKQDADDGPLLSQVERKFLA